jgi:hypothetical protein
VAAGGNRREGKQTVKRRIAGFALNAFLRASIAAMLADVMRRPNDPRYAGKAIPIRNLLIVGGLSLAFPALHLRTHRWARYPVWSDNLYLSLFWLDMVGNALNLYDTHLHFDLIPHFHGSGALAAVLHYAFDVPGWRAIGIANAVHVALEAQEYATDVFFSTHNVRGAWDSLGDLSVGLLGTLAYVGPAIVNSLAQQ